MSTYIKPYAKAEFNFEAQMLNTLTENIMVLNTFDKTIELEIWGCEHRKTDGTGTAVSLNVDIIQLDIPSTGGVDAVVNVDYLRANRNLRAKEALISGVELLIDDAGTPLVIDEDGSLNIFRCGGVATKDVVSFTSTGEPFFKYSLKRNTSYLVKSSIVAGLVETSESFVFGIVRELD